MATITKTQTSDFFTFCNKYFKKKRLDKLGVMRWKKPYFFILNPLLATDIDNQHNFDFCEFIYKNRKKYKLEI